MQWSQAQLDYECGVLITSDIDPKPLVLESGMAGLLLDRMAATMLLTEVSLFGVYRKVRHSAPCCRQHIIMTTPHGKHKLHMQSGHAVKHRAMADMLTMHKPARDSIVKTGTGRCSQKQESLETAACKIHKVGTCLEVLILCAVRNAGHSSGRGAVHLRKCGHSLTTVRDCFVNCPNHEYKQDGL